MKYHYFVIYKPFQVMSQFSEAGTKATLADVADFPKDVYPVGRLDYDSEGLLILTNDTTLNKRLLHPSNQHQRTYFAQVEGTPTIADMEKLKSRIPITVKGKKHLCLPAVGRILETPPALPERHPPIRYRKNVPDAWLEISLTEGKNRQVRKMTAAIGFPTLRLVRWSIEKLTVHGMQSGAVRSYTQKEIYGLLFND